jgi:RNA polymerase sigma factor (TIGR02999 family)
MPASTPWTEAAGKTAHEKRRPHAKLPGPMAHEITALIHAAARGDSGSNERLLTLIYGDLLRLAQSRLSRGREITDLGAAPLVHEAYMRFADNLPQDLACRRVFFAYAARAMESVIIDHLRRRGAQKRGDGIADVTLATGLEGEQQTFNGTQFEDLHTALARLERIDAQLHEIVQLRYFAGMTIDQIAELLELSSATVKRRWSAAMAILRREMECGSG